MKTIGKCVVCRDPVFDFQEIKFNGKRLPFHKGCLREVSKEVLKPQPRKV